MAARDRQATHSPTPSERTPEPISEPAPDPGDDLQPSSRRERAQTRVTDAADTARTAVSDAVAAAKPKLRGWLHLVITPLALAAGIVLIALAPTATAAAAAVAYALTSVSLFAVSAVYHRGRWSDRARMVFKRVDHANIFLIIAGTYTPFAILALHGTTRLVLLVTVWAGALLGATFRIVWVDAPRWLYVPFYVGLGWAAVFVTPQLIQGAGVAAFTLVATGGGLYTLGAIIYALRWPDPSPRYFGFHEVFHALTIAAYVCQYVAASLVVYRS